MSTPPPLREHDMSGPPPRGHLISTSLQLPSWGHDMSIPPLRGYLISGSSRPQAPPPHSYGKSSPPLPSPHPTPTDILTRHRKSKRLRPQLKHMPTPTPSQAHLVKSRLNLLRTLPKSHRLHTRTASNGTLKHHRRHPINMPRIPFSDDELAEIKSRRRYAADPDDVRYQLQDANKEQWMKYKMAKWVTEGKREVVGVPKERFDSEEAMEGRRRRKVIREGPGNENGSRIVVDGNKKDDNDHESKNGGEGMDLDLEEGEIEEKEEMCYEELNATEDDMIDGDTLYFLAKERMKLRLAKDTAPAMAEDLVSASSTSRPSSLSSSSPSSTTCEQAIPSEDGSDDSVEAVYGSGGEDSDDDDSHGKGLGVRFSDPDEIPWP